MFKDSVCTLLVLSLCSLFCAVYGQLGIVSNFQVPELPPIACPNYFQYIRNGNTYFGKITLPRIQMGTTQVNVEFSQRFPVEPNKAGSISLNQDEEATIKSLQNGQPVSYRVDFPRINVVPKLTQIAVNGMIICSASEYPAPSVSLKLQHSFTFTLPSLQQTTQSVHPIDGSAVYYIQQEEPDFYRTKSTAPQLIPLKPRPPLKSGAALKPRPLQVPQRTQPQQPEQIQPQQARPEPQQTQPEPQQLRQNQPPVQQKNVETAVCGQEGAASNNFIPFIYGGRPLRRGEYPWLTAIYRKHTSGMNFICGGSLISSSLVLSAAHCFDFLTSDKISVVLGRYNLSNSMEDVVSRDIQSLIVHPEYNGGQRFPDADLALLRMYALVSFTSLISPICLWTEPADESLIVGQSGMVAGWGTDESNNISPVPKKTEADVVSEKQCWNSSLGFYSITSERTLCAGKRDGTGPCIGDSGGALMMLRNNRWVLRGIVSAGQTERMRCNLLEFVLYCDVAKHITWVQRYL